jgi:hypothetical protein
MHQVLYTIYKPYAIGRRKALPTSSKKLRAQLVKLGEKKIASLRKKRMGRAVDAEMAEDSLDLAKFLLSYYLREHATSDFRKRKWVALEKTFAVPFNGVLLRGKIDGLYRDDRGHLWLFETKTKGQISDEVLTYTLCVDFQISFYVIAAEEMLGEKIRGVEYNVIRRPRHASEASMKDAILNDPTHFFPRWEIKFNRRDIRRFRAELGDKLREFRAWCKGDRPTFREQWACAPTPGFVCDYLPICAFENYDEFRRRKVVFPELVIRETIG